MHGLSNCLRCGYPLFGLTESSRCPECALPLWISKDRGFARPKERNSELGCLALLCVSNALFICGVHVWCLFVWGGTPPWATMTERLCEIASFLGLAVAYWNLVRILPRDTRFIRLCALLSFVGLALQILLAVLHPAMLGSVYGLPLGIRELRGYWQWHVVLRAFIGLARISLFTIGWIQVIRLARRDLRPSMTFMFLFMSTLTLIYFAAHQIACWLIQDVRGFLYVGLAEEVLLTIRPVYDRHYITFHAVAMALSSVWLLVLAVSRYRLLLAFANAARVPTR